MCTKISELAIIFLYFLMAVSCDGMLNIGNMNIVYIKVTKVGGSTVGGVVRRICDHYHLSGCRDRSFISHEPGIWANHRPMYKLQPSIRSLQHPALLMTWLRDPIERAMSKFYHFEVSCKNSSTSTEAKLVFLRNFEPNPQLQYISSSGEFQQNVTAVLDAFDFVGITERFDESMILLAQTLNLTLCDIIYLRAKDSHLGSVDDTGVPFVPHTLFKNESPAVQQYLTGAAFKDKNALDYALLRAIHHKINGAIKATEADQFAEALHVYRTVLAAAAEICSPALSPWNCYWNDNGCGYPCLDQFCSAFPTRMNSTFPFPWPRQQRHLQRRN